MIEIEMKDTGATPKLLKRELNNINRDGAREMADHWFANFRQKHFTSAGATEYGYAPRQGERGNPGSRGFRRSYTGRKLRKFGHTKPLVYTGDSEREANIRDIRAVSRAGNAVGRVVIHARKLNFRPKNGSINLREEMTRISTREAKELTEVASGYIFNRFQAIRQTQTTTIS